MSLARGFSVAPVSFQLPLLSLPFEQIQSTMQQYQTEKDLYGEFQNMMPKYLQEDAPQAQAYKQLVDDLSGQVTSAFVAGNTGDAMRTLRLAQSKLKKQWQPGGLASSLNSRYDQFAKALSEIEAHTKDFQNPTYRNFYQDQVQQQVAKGLGYNPETGTYNTINTPSLVAEVKLGEEVDNYLKGWAADKGYNISKSPDGFWYYKETNKQVSADELQSALKNFYNQPHIEYALGVQTWDRLRSIPEDQKEVILNEARQQKRSELESQLESQYNQLDRLQSAVKSGNRGQIKQIQTMLQNSGFNVKPDGIAGPATMQALNDYIQDTQSVLQEQESMVEPAVENMSLDAYVQDQYKESLTNAYVPKYAFTEKDIDLIADQVAIARLKISAQQQLAKGLMATFQGPAKTLISPVVAEPIKMEGVGQQLSTARRSYSELEQNIARNLPADWQQMFKGVGVDWANPAQTSSMQRSTTQMVQAVQAAQTAEGIDPFRYREAMASQGVTLTPRQLQQQLALFENGDNLKNLERLNNTLTPAFRSVEIAGDTYNHLVDAAVASDKINWTSVAAEAGIKASVFGTTATGLQTTGRSKEEVEAEIQQLIKQGDPKALAAFDRWRSSHSDMITNEELGVANVDIIINESLDDHRKQIETLAKSNLAAVVNFNSLDSTTKEQLGFDDNGTIKLVDGKPAIEVTSAQFGTRNINGRSEPIMLISTSRTSKPVVVSMDGLDKNWVRDVLRTGAAAAMNPNNPGEIIDRGSFDAFAGMMFDVEQDAGTAFSANQVRIMNANGMSGPIGLSTVELSSGTVRVESFLIPAAGGGVSYYVATTDPATAQQLKNISGLTQEDLSAISKSRGTVAVDVENSYNGAKDAIFSAKASLQRDVLQQDLLTNPYQYKTSSTNQTQNAAMIGIQQLLQDF